MRYPVWSEEFVFPPLSFLCGAVCHSEERQATFLFGYPPHITTTTTTTAAYC